MMHLRYGIVLAVILSLLLAGCAGMAKRERLHKLEKALQEYAAALRWGRYSDAHDYVWSRDGSKPGLDVDGFEGYRIAGMNFIRSDLNEDETEAKVYAVVQFYSDQRATIREMKQVQDWWYHAESERWFLDGDLPYLHLKQD